MYAALSSKDWELASSLFELARGSDFRGPHGEPFLHMLAHMNVPTSLFSLAFTRHSNNLLDEYDGFMCLHVALLCGAPLETLYLLLQRHPPGPLPSARSKRPGVTLGLTPLCCALLAEPPAPLPVIDALLRRDKMAASVECEGLGTPLCLSLRRKASVGVVHAIFTAHPEAAAIPFSPLLFPQQQPSYPPPVFIASPCTLSTSLVRTALRL